MSIIAAMAFSSEVKTILSPMPESRLSNLTIHYDSDDFFNQLDPRVIDDICFGYHTAWTSFNRWICLDPKDSYQLSEFPEGHAVLTASRDVFKALYHSPERFDVLPDWVHGYVNFRNSIYVQLFDGRNTPRENDNSDTHEFIHTVIPAILGIRAEILSQLWPTWIQEAFTVGLSQRRKNSWIAGEAEISPEKIPTLASLKEKGIFAHDNRKPAVNVAYQYCALLGETLGREANQRLGSETHYMGDLGGICRLTEIAYEGSSTIFDEVSRLGISLDALEKQARQEIGLLN